MARVWVSYLRVRTSPLHHHHSSTSPYPHVEDVRRSTRLSDCSRGDVGRDKLLFIGTKDRPRRIQHKAPTASLGEEEKLEAPSREGDWQVYEW
jgi:hypothetical protein